MVAYEVLLMLDAGVAEPRQAEIVDRVRALVEKGGGSWQQHVPWGKRRLAYEIGHKDEGIYHLLLFTAAARKLAYSTLGMLQFLAPTLQFLIGVYYGERFTTAHAIAFPAIWIALALYVTALLRAPRLPEAPE